MLKSFYLPKSYNIKKGERTIKELNDLLKCVGVNFSVSKKENGLSLVVAIDEKKLKKVTAPKQTGRPKGYDFDLERVQQLKAEGKMNKEIYKELGMSKSLFYLRMKEHNTSKASKKI